VLRSTCRIALSAGLLAFLYSRVRAGPWPFAWDEIRTGPLLAGVGLGLGGLAVQWLKWHRLLAAVRPGSRRWESLASLFGGFSLGAVSPGRLGELGRAVFLRDRRVAASAGAVADRLSSFAVTVSLGLLGLWVSSPALAAQVSLVLTAAAAGAWVLATRSRLPGWAWLAPLAARWTEGRAVLARLPASRWAEIAAWSMLYNAVFAVQFYVCATALGHVPLAVLPVIPAIFAAKALVPLGFMDLGVREGAAVFFFGRLGVSPAIGLGAALLVFGVNVLAPAVLGLAAILGLRPTASGPESGGPDAGGRARD